MKNYSWNIKIADLLNNPGEYDNIKFEKKYIENIEEPGISGEIFLQGLNHNEILLELKNIKFSQKYICDKCLEKYIKNFYIENEKNIKFVNPQEIKIEENIHDNTFPIDIKNKTINIKELIEIIVKNQEPIVKNCGKHKNTEEGHIQKNQESFFSYKVDFGKLLKS